MLNLIFVASATLVGICLATLFFIYSVLEKGLKRGNEKRIKRSYIIVFLSSCIFFFNTIFSLFVVIFPQQYGLQIAVLLFAIGITILFIAILNFIIREIKVELWPPPPEEMEEK